MSVELEVRLRVEVSVRDAFLEVRDTCARLFDDDEELVFSRLDGVLAKGFDAPIRISYGDSAEVELSVNAWEIEGDEEESGVWATVAVAQRTAASLALLLVVAVSLAERSGGEISDDATLFFEQRYSSPVDGRTLLKQGDAGQQPIESVGLALRERARGQ